MLFLTDFAGDLALDAADDPFAAFDFGADDAEAVEGNRGLLWLLRLLRLLVSWHFARRIGGRGGCWLWCCGLRRRRSAGLLESAARPGSCRAEILRSFRGGGVRGPLAAVGLPAIRVPVRVPCRVARLRGRRIRRRDLSHISRW